MILYPSKGDLQVSVTQYSPIKANSTPDNLQLAQVPTTEGLMFELKDLARYMIGVGFTNRYEYLKWRLSL